MIDLIIRLGDAMDMERSPFMENGLPTILYERRHFYRFATEKQTALSKETVSKVTPKKGKNKKPHVENPYPDFPDLCFPTGDDYGPGGLHQYEKLARAANLDFEIALKSYSWGGFQILGGGYFLDIERKFSYFVVRNIKNCKLDLIAAALTRHRFIEISLSYSRWMQNAYIPDGSRRLCGKCAVIDLAT